MEEGRKLTEAIYTPESLHARNSIGYLIRRARNLMTARIEQAFEGHAITFAQWTVLMQLRDGLATTAAEISRNMGYDSGALTRMLEQLAQRGLIERERISRDRRVVGLKLTGPGRTAVNALVPNVVDLLNLALADFTREDTETLTYLLQKFVTGVSGDAS